MTQEIQTYRIKIALIRRDGGTQSRVDVNQAVIEEYAEDKRNNAKFPAVTIFRDSEGNYWLADGFQRVAADELNGTSETYAEIIEGTLQDAILYAVQANQAHGLRRTNADKRHAVEMVLAIPEWRNKSDWAIAEHVGISPTAVGKVRKALASPESEGDQIRVDKHGRTMSTGRIGRWARKIVPANPERKETLYGEPIDFRGLRHAPINEQGVVYMFGMVSRELGFLIESLRTGYPDCEGKHLVDEKRKLWKRVLIEFEFRSSNFQKHGHNPNECDVIVCWIHDWPDHPSNLEIIELRSKISALPGK